ncbi:MAG: FAD-binding protein, partial [Clostridia bacterium]|nr:FAD-binding protein [Clostridia bacterium]
MKGGNFRMFDLVVIGTGAGLTVAEAAAKRGLEVAIVEKGKFGGTCLTRGCIPSKMLVYPADMLREAERAHKVGLTFEKPRIDWDLISRRVWERIDVSKEIEQTFSTIPNVTCFKGEGRFTG